MNKYVVAYLDIVLGGEIKQEIVEANTKFEALVSYLGWTEEDYEGLDGSSSELVERVFDQDGYINAIEITHARASRSGPGLQTQSAQFDSESRVQ